MKTVYKLFSKIFCFSVLLVCSCKKMVDVGAPETQLVSSTVFDNDASATAAQLAIYSQMEAEGLPFNLAVATGLSADEFTNYSVNPDYADLYNNSLTSLNNVTYGLWTSLYKYNYEANAVLEGINTSSTLSQAVRKQLSGEAKFTRAFCHFYLTNLFGDVPLIQSTNYQLNSVSTRTTTSSLYRFIIQDLKDATSLLSDNYISSTNTSTTERVRPNLWAATALLARAYLYTTDWVNAEAMATAVISQNTKYSLVPNVDNVFLKNSTEAIWQLQPVIPRYNTIEGGTFILTTTPSIVALSTDFVNNFSNSDKRKSSWIKSITVAGSTYYYPYKYKVGQNAPTITEYSMMIRLAELYLIRAEARARQGNISGAADDLNLIRNRAGLPNTTANTQTDLLNAIIQERRLELFSEMGHRWFDLKHMGQASILSSKGTNWTASAQLYPIPQKEIINDPNLTQNPGY